MMILNPFIFEIAFDSLYTHPSYRTTLYIYTGCSLEHVYFPYIGNVIIPTDFHSIIFQRGRLGQPPTSIYIPLKTTNVTIELNTSCIYTTKTHEMSLLNFSSFHSDSNGFFPTKKPVVPEVPAEFPASPPLGL